MSCSRSDGRRVQRGTVCNDYGPAERGMWSSRGHMHCPAFSAFLGLSSSYNLDAGLGAKSQLREAPHPPVQLAACEVSSPPCSQYLVPDARVAGSHGRGSGKTYWSARGPLLLAS
ncbi:hypothetical protein C8R44DRAFT_868353 [Mycena epipterygia]|nr:hypothetical protein C8R44DRAFT_868353 [Mycena epipterygia]